MDMEVFLQKERIFPGAHKIGPEDTLSGPVLRDTARLSQPYPLLPLLRAMGVLMSQHGHFSCNAPSPPF